VRCDVLNAKNVKKSKNALSKNVKISFDFFYGLLKNLWKTMASWDDIKLSVLKLKVNFVNTD
jgi:hypothetical protein